MNIYTLKFRVGIDPLTVELSQMIESETLQSALFTARAKSKETGWNLLGVYQSYLDTGRLNKYNKRN